MGASLPLSGAEPMHPFEGREEMRDKALEEIVEIFQRAKQRRHREAQAPEAASSESDDTAV